MVISHPCLLEPWLLMPTSYKESYHPSQQQHLISIHNYQIIWSWVCFHLPIGLTPLNLSQPPSLKNTIASFMEKEKRGLYQASFWLRFFWLLVLFSHTNLNLWSLLGLLSPSIWPWVYKILHLMGLLSKKWETGREWVCIKQYFRILGVLEQDYWCWS